MPAAPPQEPAAPVPKTELEQLQFKAQTCTDDVIYKYIIGSMESTCASEITSMSVFSCFFLPLVLGEYAANAGPVRRGKKCE